MSGLDTPAGDPNRVGRIDEVSAWTGYAVGSIFSCIPVNPTSH